VDSVAVGQKVQLTMSAPGKLGGVVLDDSGRPPAYFQIAIDNKENAQRLVVEFGPDARGRWTIDQVAPGTVGIRVQTPEGVAAVTKVLSPSQRLDDIELRLQPWGPSAQR
jgi:hypothetical protein